MKHVLIFIAGPVFALCFIIFTSPERQTDDSNNVNVPKLVEPGELIEVGGAHYAPDDSVWDGKHMAIILPGHEELVFAMISGEEVAIREVNTGRLWQYAYYPRKNPKNEWDPRGTLYLHQADTKTPNEYFLSLNWTTQYTGTFKGDRWPNSFNRDVFSEVRGAIEIR